MLSKRINLITPSVTLEIDAKAKEMIAAGEDVLNFTAGEPDFPVADHIKEAAKEAVDQDCSKYTATGGLPELKDAIVKKLKNENQVETAPENVIVTNGGKEGLFLLFQAILDEGDEVVIPTPYWVSYAEQVRYSGATPVMVQPDGRFHFSAQDIESAITGKTKALVLNTPSNPTGAVIAQETLEGIAELAKKHGFLVVSDEVYEHFVYDGHVHHSIAAMDGMNEHTVIINALSKSYSMPGWRLGYAAGPEEIIKAMTKLKGHLSSNAMSVSQKAAVAALTGPQDVIDTMRSEFAARRSVVMAGFSGIEGCELSAPEGAFYAFVDFAELMGKKGINDSFELCGKLLDAAQVALVPGEAFGEQYTTYARFSFATATDTIGAGIERIKKFST